jgi:inorganic pyrophosphatase
VSDAVLAIPGEIFAGTRLLGVCGAYQRAMARLGGHDRPCYPARQSTLNQGLVATNRRHWSTAPFGNPRAPEARLIGCGYPILTPTPSAAFIDDNYAGGLPRGGIADNLSCSGRASAKAPTIIERLSMATERPFAIWGFVPATKADDGDPLDIMVIHDAATFPRIVLTCRIIGICRSNRGAKGRPSGATVYSQYPALALGDGPARCPGPFKPIQQELEKFFIATDELEDKKLEIIGWKGPKITMKAIQDSAKNFLKDGA